MLPKFAESGTGGIPRRAFNNPRALESLGSSNLSNQFGGEEAFAREARLNGRQLPALNTRAFVRGGDDAYLVQREMRKDVREIRKALPSMDKDGIAYKTLVSREVTLRQELAVIERQILNGGYLNTRVANLRANPNGNIYVPKEYADRARVRTTNSF